MASNSKDVENITTTMMKLNTGKDKLNDMIMMADTRVSWDQFISPAPNSIAILGQLMLLSCKKDFSLETAKPQGGFKFLNFPKSFRATLVQVSGAGFKAFNTADANMLQIMLLTSNVSDHIRNATKCLIVGTPEDIETTMPLILNKVDRVAIGCLKLSQEIVECFEYVGDLLIEILQSCLTKDTENKEELDKQKLIMEDLEKMKEHHKKNVDEAEEEYKELERKLESAESQYSEAIDSMPSGGAIAAMSLANTMISSTCNLLKVVGPAVATSVGGPMGLVLATVCTAAISAANSNQQPTDQTIIPKSPPHTTTETFQRSRIEIQVFESMMTFHGRIEGLEKLYSSEDPNQRERELSRLIVHLISSSQEKVKELDQRDCDIARDYKWLLEDLVSCCEDIKKTENQNSDNIKRRLGQISKKSNELKTQADHTLGNRGLPTPLPSQGNIMREQIQSTPQDAVDSWIKTSQFKVEQTRQNLEQVRILKREQNKIKQETHEKFLEKLHQLEKANTEELNLNDIKAILAEGIKTMANLKEKWNLLTHFFTRISGIIKATVSVNLKDFRELVEAETKLKQESETYTLTKFKRDSIFQNAFTACATAYFVNRIAKTYNDVSQNHLMAPLSALDKLVTFDPVTEKDEIAQQSHQINHECSQAQEYIKALVEKSCRDLEEYSKQRMKEIEDELGSILPPLEREDKLSIEQETSIAAQREKATNTNMDYEHSF